MYDYFCSDSNEMSESESKKQGDETLQKIKQERALQQYREEIDYVFSGWESVLCFKRWELVQVVGDQCDAR
jgi:hypothetical protein